MASYDELQFLDSMDDLIDAVYDVEGYGEVRKAYDELSGYDVYRQWIEPDLVEKGWKRRAAIGAAVGAAAIGGGMAANRRLKQGPVSFKARGHTFAANRSPGRVNVVHTQSTPGGMKMHTASAPVPHVGAHVARARAFGSSGVTRAKKFGATAPTRARAFGAATRARF
jgi:hypothetical protein